MCVEGASSVHEKAIRKIDSDDLQVFVIWTPRYPGDSRTKARASTKTVPDQRATHFWDAAGIVPKLYGKVLGLPKGKQFAWDTYMVFGADAAWETAAPEPAEWRHQLGSVLGMSHPRWLDANEFQSLIASVLQH